MEKIKELIKSERLIVIVRGVKSEQLIPLAEAMYEGGVRLLEVTYSADGRVSDEETAQNIGALVKHFGDRMQIGAGTVLTEKQVALTAAAGGKYIISPNGNPAVINATKKAGLVSIPAAYTPTEIEAAYECGADFVKLFPVTALGPAYVKAVRGPSAKFRSSRSAAWICPTLQSTRKPASPVSGSAGTSSTKKCLPQTITRRSPNWRSSTFRRSNLFTEPIQTAGAPFGAPFCLFVLVFRLIITRRGRSKESEACPPLPI